MDMILDTLNLKIVFVIFSNICGWYTLELLLHIGIDRANSNV